MIANFFNKTKPAVTFIIILCFFVYFTASTFLFKLDEFSIFFFLNRTSVFIAFALFLIIAKFIINKNNLTQDNSLALFILVFLIGTFYETFFFNNILLANFTLLLSFRKVYSLRSVINTKQKLFDASFWVGIATFFNSWSILFLLLIYVGMLIYKKNDLKNLFIPIVGFLCPTLLYFTYFFYFNEVDAFYSHWIFDANFNYATYNSFKLLIPISFLLTLTLWSIISVTPNLVTISKDLKNSWGLILFHLFLSAIIIAISPVKNGSEMFFMIFPLAVIVTNFLQKRQSENFKNLILYLFIAISITVYFL